MDNCNMNSSYTKEMIVTNMTILSFISIMTQAIGNFMNRRELEHFLPHETLIFTGIVLTEMFLIYFLWQMILLSSNNCHIKMICIFVYLLICIISKRLCSGMFVLMDVFLLITRIIYMIFKYHVIKGTNICYRCNNYAIEESMYKIMRIRLLIHNVNDIYVLFSVITTINALNGKYYLLGLIFFCLLICNHVLSKFDKNESVPVRVFFLCFYSANVACEMLLLRYKFEIKE